MTHLKHVLLAGAAVLALSPMAALAATPAAPSAHELELEARLKQLEAAVTDLRAELNATHVQAQTTAQVVDARAPLNDKITARVAALEAKTSKPAPDGFNVGGVNVKVYGYIKTNLISSHYDSGIVQQNPASPTLIKDFYLPQQIPVGGGRSSTDFTAEAKQTRLGATVGTSVGKHVVKGLVEFDFQTSQGVQGSQRTTNGYNLALRRGFVQFDNLLVGQEWSNFQNQATLPETTDFVGPTEGTIFVRQAQVRYTQPFGKGLSIAASVENAATATITPTSASMVENDADKLPDVTVRLNYASKAVDLSLAGLARQLSYDNGLAGATQASARATGWGISFAGKVAVPFGVNSDLRFMVTKGSGIGRYVGLNFAPDAVQLSTPGVALSTVDIFAGFAALKLGWTAKLRSTLMFGYQKDDYNIAVPATANAKSVSLAGNLFYSPIKNFDVGIEYRHGQRTLVSGMQGQLDRIEFASKYSF
jgi:hypothetical protein